MVRTILLALVWLPSACNGSIALEAQDETPPPGGETVEAYPIDRGDDGPHTPGAYKGLWLRLADNGKPDVTAVDGVIGVVCVGMSNASQECGVFLQQAQGAWAAEIGQAVRVVNCAVGGHAIERWIDPAYDATLWDACLQQRIPNAGLRADQVRVLYHKAANQFTTTGGSPLPPFPAPGSDYERFLANLSAFAARVAAKFPAVQAVYTSSRSYGGFANNPGRGEPLSYEEGHALNGWLRDHARVNGVWYGWGPYLWAPDCAGGVTNGSGTCYVRADYVEDGVHPSNQGRAKIAGLIHQRLLAEPWYRRE